MPKLLNVNNREMTTIDKRQVCPLRCCFARNCNVIDSSTLAILLSWQWRTHLYLDFCTAPCFFFRHDKTIRPRQNFWILTTARWPLKLACIERSAVLRRIVMWLAVVRSPICIIDIDASIATWIRGETGLYVAFDVPLRLLVSNVMLFCKEL